MRSFTIQRPPHHNTQSLYKNPSSTLNPESYIINPKPNPQDIANLAWSAAVLELRSPRVTEKIWEGMKYLAPMSPVDLSQVMCLTGFVRFPRKN
jgi:hypothetical protein